MKLDKLLQVLFIPCHAFVYQLLCSLPIRSTGWLELLPSHGVVGDEKMLNLVNNRLIQMIERVNIAVIRRSSSDSDQPVILHRFAMLCLLRLDHTYQPRGNQATHKGLLIQQDKHINRVPISSQRRWDVAKIVRENEAKRQQVVQHKQPIPLIILKFVSAPRRRINNHIERSRFRINGSSRSKIEEFAGFVVI